jgi:hypothetical protein
MTVTQPTKRACYYTNESFAERINGKVVYHAALVIEGEAGYTKICIEEGRADDLEFVQRRCDHVNGALGLTPDDVLDIVGSSMRQGPIKPRELWELG